jgi:hypothetical protein
VRSSLGPSLKRPAHKLKQVGGRGLLGRCGRRAPRPLRTPNQVSDLAVAYEVAGTMNGALAVVGEWQQR